MDKVKNRTPSVSLKDINFTPILIAVLVLFITFGKLFKKNKFEVKYKFFLFPVILFLWKKRKTSRTDLLLTGLCDSGKTALFSQLLYSKESETFTSITENVGEYKCNKGVLRLVDIPGHERLRIKFFDQYKSYAKAIVYVVDSVTFQKDIRDVAE